MTTPNLNQATVDLIDALDALTAMRGFREGLRSTIAYIEANTHPDAPDHAEAVDVLRVWRALDDLAAAVQIRKEN